MSKAKADAMKLIESLPDDCTWDDIKYRMYVRDAIESGLADVEAGRVMPAEEAKRRIAEWLASPGPTLPSDTSVS